MSLRINSTLNSPDILIDDSIRSPKLSELIQYNCEMLCPILERF